MSEQSPKPSIKISDEYNAQQYTHNPPHWPEFAHRNDSAFIDHDKDDVDDEDHISDFYFTQYNGRNYEIYIQKDHGDTHQPLSFTGAILPSHLAEGIFPSVMTEHSNTPFYVHVIESVIVEGKSDFQIPLIREYGKTKEEMPRLLQKVFEELPSIADEINTPSDPDARQEISMNIYIDALKRHDEYYLDLYKRLDDTDEISDYVRSRIILAYNRKDGIGAMAIDDVQNRMIESRTRDKNTRDAKKFTDDLFQEQIIPMIAEKTHKLIDSYVISEEDEIEYFQAIDTLRQNLPEYIVNNMDSQQLTLDQVKDLLSIEHMPEFIRNSLIVTIQDLTKIKKLQSNSADISIINDSIRKYKGNLKIHDTIFGVQQSLLFKLKKLVLK